MFLVWNILTSTEKKKFLFISILIFISVFAELLSLGIIIPFVSIIIDENSEFKKIIIENNDLINFISEQNLIYFLCFALFLIFLLKNLYLMFFNYSSQKFLHNTINNTTARIFAKTINSDVGYHLSNSTSKEVNQHIGEINFFGNGIRSVLGLATEIPVLIGIFTFLAFFQPKIFIILFLITFFMSLIYYFLFKNKIKSLGEFRKKGDELKLRYVHEGLFGIKEIKIYEKENFVIQKFKLLCQSLSKNYYIFGNCFNYFFIR